ncbi:uncharacterized protein LOC131846844 [Achroia grisella]|uniref:uncharacterized protein LOC131846844 n=1 Tax=Achroia grisella TaxID=688607 RepID=UPI0027D1F2CE|nr:uncharacterized protein LOC131846844 [Achroia grisella]
MAENNDVQALEKISTQVNETQIKITLSSHCIKATCPDLPKCSKTNNQKCLIPRIPAKRYCLLLFRYCHLHVLAQAFLFNKLKKQSERQKEICIIISNSNQKLEAEIKQAEQEINSLIIANETIKSANIELKKECLLAQERKCEIHERVTQGQEKYENLWLECKSRYESIPRIQKLVQSTNKVQVMKESIIALESEIKSLVNQILEKKICLLSLDQSRVIAFAKFFVNEGAQYKKEIKAKSAEIVILEQEINKTLKEQECRANEDNILNTVKDEVRPTVDQSDKKFKEHDDDWPILNSIHETLRLPKLQLLSTEFDDLSSKLDQIKIKKTELIQSTSSKRTYSITNESEATMKRPKKEETSLFYYFNKPISTEDKVMYLNYDSSKDNFSKKKLINILEDIKIDKNDTYKIISKVKRDSLKDVITIGTDIVKDGVEVTEEKQQVQESEQIEEIDLTNTNIRKPTESIIIPPTQFLDLSQATCNSQESTTKKKVSFDLPIPEENITLIHGDDNDEVIAIDQSINSELNASHVSAESYTKLKDMMLKKHNLDLSPQFVYAKNTVLQTRNEDKVITSKFFQHSNIVSDIDLNENDIQKVVEVEETHENIKETDHVIKNQSADLNEGNLVAMQENNIVKIDKTLTGLLFSHGTQGIPDSLNVSISTTGFEEGEDFPHCIDSSLLLSPKANIVPGSENVEVLSQEVPNFLSGLRKSAFSFFGSSSNTETNNQPLGIQNQQNNNFSFNFGDDEKKNRGGLFSMFH